MTQQIEQLLKEHFYVNGKVTIHPDGTVDVTGDVSLIELVSQLPVKFGSVNGHFYCSDNNLTSLEGAPQSVDGIFTCSYNNLTSLTGAPKSVGDFYCNYNSLTSLVGAPELVSGDFNCEENKLTSLEGAPQSVGGNFDCHDNKLTSLVGAPKSVGGDFIAATPLKSLEGIPSEIKNTIYLKYNRNLPLLRLITIQVRDIDLRSPPAVTAIITKYLNKPTRPERYKAAMLCAKELTDAGYPGNAKL